MKLFEDFPANSRVWIYQANRPLTIEERELSSALLEEFVSSWAAHGKKLTCDYNIFHKRFIVLIVNEENQPATGCSIDDSVAIIRKISESININLFDRMSVAFRSDSGLVVSSTMEDFEKMIEEGDIHKDTTVFNNMVTNLGDLRDKWEVPLSESWHSRMLPKKESAI